MEQPDPNTEDRSVEARDERALSALERVDEALSDALRAMPNHVDSVFDGRDVERLDAAKRDVQLLIAGYHDERACELHARTVRGY